MTMYHFKSIQTFLDSRTYYDYPVIKAKPFIDFVTDRRLNIVYDSPDMKGECPELSRKKIKKACAEGYKDVFKALFRAAMLLKGTAKRGSKRAVLVSHTAMTAEEIMHCIKHWEEFTDYIYRHRLMVSIYENPNMSFLACETKSVITIEYKDNLKDGYLGECELVRVYDMNDVLTQVYMVTTNKDTAQEFTVQNTDVKFLQITINNYGMWTPPDPYERRTRMITRQLMLS